MLDRISEPSPLRLAPSHIDGIGAIETRPVPDHEVTASEEASGGSTEEREPEHDLVQISSEGAALVAHSEEAESDAASADSEDEQEHSFEAAGTNGEVHAEEEHEAETGELTSDEQRELQGLRARDIEVRAHEQAHSGAGGALTGAPSFQYETGPDGNQYAVGGEVSVSLGKGATPDEKIRNAQTARRAALAPAQPSAQDLSVAAEATKIETHAQAEKAAVSQEQPESEPTEAPEASPNTQAAEESRVGDGKDVHANAAAQPHHGTRPEDREHPNDAGRSNEPARPQSPTVGRAIDAYANTSRDRDDDGSISLIA